MGFLSAGALRLPAVINSATPMGSTTSLHTHRQPHGNISHPTRRGSPPRRDAIHRVSPARGKPRHDIPPHRAGHAGRERRDESRLYAGKFPCGGMSTASRSHAARQAPPSGANYSITAGKRSAPAERQRIYIRAPRGSNAREDTPRPAAGTADHHPSHTARPATP